MKNLKQSEIKAKREIALKELSEISKNWSVNVYTDYDFYIDRILRDFKRLPKKSFGKPAYEFIKL